MTLKQFKFMENMSDDLTAAGWFFLVFFSVYLHEREVMLGGWLNANKKWKKAH